MSTDEPMFDIANQVRQALISLSQAVREMTPAGAKPIATATTTNLLARPIHNGCRICGLPSHASLSVTNASACRTALLSLVGFWVSILADISFLYQNSPRFQDAVQKNAPTYAMRLDNGPLRGGDMETVVVDGLTKNWLKWLSHLRGVRAKVNAVLAEEEVGSLDGVVKQGEGFLLGGLTLSDLYEKSIQEGK